MVLNRSPETTLRMFITLLLYLFCGSTVGDITAVCEKSAILRCPALAELDHVQYRAVSWYRVSEGHFSGIIWWDRRTKSVRRFVNLNQTVECPPGDGLTLILSNLTSEDSGTYRCSLWAPVGHSNRQWDMQLSVTGCPNSNVVDTYWPKDILLYGALLLLGFTLLLLCVWMLEKQLSTKGKDIKPTLEAYVSMISFFKKPYGLISQNV